MNLDEMLGFNANDPADRHAEILVDEHDMMIKALVNLRISSGLKQEEVAASMGIDTSGVSKIERGDRDLHLSTLRRYAFAVGAVIRHDVEPFDAVRRRENAAAHLSAHRAPRPAWSNLSAVVSARPLSDSGHR